MKLVVVKRYLLATTERNAMTHPTAHADTDHPDTGLVHDGCACVEHVDAAGRTVTRLGRWTGSHVFDVRVRRGSVVLDLRSTDIDGDVDVRLAVDRGVVTLLVPEDAAIDEWDLELIRGGKVKQTFHTEAAGGRTVHLSGRAERGEIRIHSGGIAQLSAIFSRDFLQAACHGRRDRVADILHDTSAHANDSRAS
jgi:hypothetical protein